MLTKTFKVGNSSPNNAAMVSDLQAEDLEDATMEFIEDAIAETLQQFTNIKVLGVSVDTSIDVFGYDVEVTYEETKKGR